MRDGLPSICLGHAFQLHSFSPVVDCFPVVVLASPDQLERPALLLPPFFPVDGISLPQRLLPFPPRFRLPDLIDRQEGEFLQALGGQLTADEMAGEGHKTLRVAEEFVLGESPEFPLERGRGRDALFRAAVKIRGAFPTMSRVCQSEFLRMEPMVTERSIRGAAAVDQGAF